MKLKLVFIVACSSLFIVSCAHKKVETTEKSKAEVTKEAPAKAIVKNDSDLGYTCQVAGDKRIVTLDKQSKKCEVHYTKFGKKEQMAWGQSNPKVCDDVYTNIRTNIEKRGFKCTSLIKDEKENRKTASAK